jgi:hypothetical protein
MHKPLERMKPEDFVDSIVDQLKPLKYPEPEYFTSAPEAGVIGPRRPKLPMRAAVSADVLHTITTLRKALPVWERFADRRANRSHAKKLNKALTAVEAQLASAPAALDSRMFLNDGVDPTKMRRKALEDYERDCKARRDSFSDALRNMRKVCGHAINPGFGNHPNVKLAGRLCARFAAVLMEDCSLKSKPTSGQETPFHTIACLLYEAVTGDKPGKAGLQRACNDFIRSSRE